jgi:peptidoglycan/LPS O-acetylase OafA/YrhL
LKQENNFDGVRLVLAIIVVFVHTATLTATPEFRMWRPWLSSDFAVKGFFAISGFLVTKSYLTSHSVVEYFEKRARRIYPAYFVTILACFVIGLAVTQLPLGDFLTQLKTWKYLFANLAFANFLQPTLPGVFEGNPEPFMDGALWTIKVEVCLYFLVPLVVLGYKKLGALPVTVFCYVFSVAWVMFFQSIASKGGISRELANQFPGQLSFFVAGAYFAYSKISAKNLALTTGISLLAFLIFKSLGFRMVAEPLFYASLTLFLATCLPWKLYQGKYGDFSYGVYLVHFPIIQLLIHFGMFKGQPFVGLGITLVIVAIVAILMWHLVEKGFLKRSAHLQALK